MHYVIYAEQSEFMKPYIILNNEKRTQCLIIKDKIGAQPYKLMNNVFPWGIEVRKIINYYKHLEKLPHHQKRKQNNCKNHIPKIFLIMTIFHKFGVLIQVVISDKKILSFLI